MRHFGLQRDAMGRIDPRLHLQHQLFEVLCGGRSMIDDEIGVLERHGGIPDAQALEPRTIDEPRGMIPGRVLENRTAAPLTDGLGIAAARSSSRTAESSPAGCVGESHARGRKPFISVARR